MNSAGISGRLGQPAKPELWTAVDFGRSPCRGYGLLHQAEGLVRAAEKRSGQYPKRRTELLQKRIEALVKNRAPAEKRWGSEQANLETAQRMKEEVSAQLREEFEVQTHRSSRTSRPPPRAVDRNCSKKTGKDARTDPSGSGRGENPASAARTIGTRQCRKHTTHPSLFSSGRWLWNL